VNDLVSTRHKLSVCVDRVVIRGLAQAPDPATLRERVEAELLAAVEADRAGQSDPAVLVADAVAQAAGGAGG
jgi:hypothetical protein